MNDIGLPKNLTYRMNRATAYVRGIYDSEVTIRAKLTEPIDVLEDALKREWLPDPAREALAALVAFRDGDQQRG